MEATMVSPYSLHRIGATRGTSGIGSDRRSSHERTEKEKLGEGEELLVVKP